MKNVFALSLILVFIGACQPNQITDPDSGMSSDRLDRINQMIADYIDKGHISGAVTLVARRGQIAHFKSAGFADINQGEEMDSSTIFRIYSMTKPITSVGLMMLYEEGAFQLWDPVSKYIPEFGKFKVSINPRIAGVEKMDPEIRIVDILRHTSGLGYGWGDGGYVDSLYASSEIWDSADLDQFFSTIREIPLYFQPGTKWRYGISTDMVGLLIERLSGMNLDRYLSEKIFKPLKMTDTFFSVPEAKVNRFATNYSQGDNESLEVIDQAEESNFVQEVSFFSGGGGLLSTARDYYRFCQMMLNGGELDGVRLLSPRTIDFMTLDHVMDFSYGGGPVRYPNDGTGFGLGFAVTKDEAGSMMLGSEGAYGWGGLAGTQFRIDPEEDLIHILMIQLIPYGHLSIRQDFNNLVYQAIID